MDPQPPAPPGAPPPPQSPYAPPPPGDPQSHGGGGARLPWEERSQIGFGPALIETTKLIITDPNEAFSRLRADEDFTSPILFGVILTWIGTLFSQIWSFLFQGAMTSMMPQQDGFAAMFAGTTVTSIIVTMIVLPVAYVIILFIAAGIYHLCLMMVGAVETSPMRFEGTLKVTAYAAVANLANVVPIVGSLIALVWTIVLLIMGFSQAHKTTQGKAAAGVLIPVAVCCVCVIIGAIAFGAAMAAAVSGGG